MRSFLLGIGGSLIAAGVAWYIRGPNTGLIIGGAGGVISLLGYLLTRKPAAPAAPLPSVHQDVKQEVNPQVSFDPQFNVSVGQAATAPSPAVEPRPEPRQNIKFIDVRSGERQLMHIFSKFAGQSLSFSTAMFENKAIKGQELLTPTVRARGIYRRVDGGLILDVIRLTQHLRRTRPGISCFFSLQMADDFVAPWSRLSLGSLAEGKWSSSPVTTK